MRKERGVFELLVGCVLATTWQATASADPVATDATKPRRAEFGAFPLAGGDSDHGFGVGGFGSYAKPNPKAPPYDWSLEAGGFITFRPVNGELTHPYQDLYMLYRNLALWQGKGRLEARVAWTKEGALNFFGIGNASEAPESETLQQNRYQRTHPEGHVRLRYQLYGPWSLEVGQTYAHNALRIGPETRLAAAFLAPPEGFESAFKTQRPHDVARSEVMFVFDTRDNELAPTRGQFFTFQTRVSPKIGNRLPFGYQQLNLTGRTFHTLIPKRLVFAGRVVGDLLLGDPPFYELARFEETNAMGGVKGLRGVLAQRYHGKVKLFGNLELRARLFDFRLFKKEFTLGAVSFFDSGRVWSDLSPRRELDGSGIGLKYGVGGGLRLLQGTTFVVRADFAWSPDARPLGAYITAGHIF